MALCSARSLAALEHHALTSAPAATQSDQFCKQLAPLVAKLNEENKDFKHDAKSLGLTVAQMLQFQEDALGVNVSGPAGGRACNSMWAAGQQHGMPRCA